MYLQIMVKHILFFNNLLIIVFIQEFLNQNKIELLKKNCNDINIEALLQ